MYYFTHIYSVYYALKNVEFDQTLSSIEPIITYILKNEVEMKVMKIINNRYYISFAFAMFFFF